MGMELGAIALGLILLIWSAGKFVDGASSAAAHIGVPPLLIGMVIVGFGTSAPEMVVSALASLQGNSGLALGNAYGSNITNIALILGVTALLSPIRVQSSVLFKEVPLLMGVTLLAGWQCYDNQLTRIEGLVLLFFFALFMVWSIYQAFTSKGDSLGDDMEKEVVPPSMSLPWSIFWIVVGMAFLIGASRLLVWGAVEIARSFGVSDLIIGLTIVAVGTSLPELASSIAATRKNEHDLALGNVLGSNLFNTLVVVGIAAIIAPLKFGAEVMKRDWTLMFFLTISLFFIGYKRGGIGIISRFEGGILVLIYCSYTGYLVMQVVSG